MVVPGIVAHRRIRGRPAALPARTKSFGARSSGAVIQLALLKLQHPRMVREPASDRDSAAAKDRREGKHTNVGERTHIGVLLLLFGGEGERRYSGSWASRGRKK